MSVVKAVVARSGCWAKYEHISFFNISSGLGNHGVNHDGNLKPEREKDETVPTETQS